MSSIPDRWAARLIKCGFTDRRSTRSETPSFGALADKIGVNTTTITDAVYGKRKPSIETVRLIVAELGDDVAEWLGVPLRDPFVPPAEADLLTPRQRKAVSELIRSIVAEEQEEVVGNVEHPAPIAAVPMAARRNTKRPPRGPKEQQAD